MNNREKKLILLGSFLIWGTLIFFQTLDSQEQQRVPLKYTTGPIPHEQGMAMKNQPVLLVKEVGETVPQSSFSQPRNIFAPLAFENRSETKPVRPRAAPSQPTPKPEPAPPPSSIAPPGPSPAELAAQRARQQLNQYRFLGYLKRGGQSQAFLTNGQAIYIVRQGETVDGHIHIQAIEPTEVVLSMKVSETGSSVETTIPLTKETS